MENNSKIVKFDPGYIPLVMNSLGQVGYIYYTFQAIKDIKLKRLNFRNNLSKIEKNLKTHISFYMGCLLWACYIKQFEDYQIEGNQLLGETDCKEEEYTSELDFLIDIVQNQLSRDSKYFLNKNYIPDERYIPILKTYREFLVLNKGFVECSTTTQIVLPDNLKKLSNEELNLINDKIQKALNEKEVEQLLDCYNLIF